MGGMEGGVEPLACGGTAGHDGRHNEGRVLRLRKHRAQHGEHSEHARVQDEDDGEVDDVALPPQHATSSAAEVGRSCFSAENTAHKNHPVEARPASSSVKNMKPVDTGVVRHVTEVEDVCITPVSSSPAAFLVKDATCTVVTTTSGSHDTMSLSTADFQCPICFDLLCRPCVLDCGFTVCESCLARTMKHGMSEQGGAAAGPLLQLMGIGRSRKSCPVLGRDCQFGPVRRLPNVQVILHNHLASLFPEEYKRRLIEDDSNKCLVHEVRKVTEGSGDERQQDQGPLWQGGFFRGVERIIRQVREDVEVFDLEPVRLPMAPPALARARLVLRHVVPWVLTGAALLLFQPQAALQSLSGTAFAQSYLVKPLGWWDVGLLTTCAGRSAVHAYELPPGAADRLARPRSFLLSRVLWPVDRLELAASMDWYHRVVATHYIVSWSLTTIYLTAYCVLHRVRRRREGGVRFVKVLLYELGLLCCLVCVAEAWNLLWWFLCRLKFKSFQCAIDYRVSPSNVIESSLLHLCLELVFIVSLLLGPSVSPDDFGLLTATWVGPARDGWETDLQALVLTRFSLMFTPRRLLALFL